MEPGKGSGGKEETMPRYRLADGDAHILEPRDLWTQRTEKAYRDRAPYVALNPNGLEGEYWIIEGVQPVSANAGGFLGATKDYGSYAEYIKGAKLDEQREGGWDPVARMKDMEIDGVTSGVLYPTNTGAMYSVSDAKLQAALFRAYNDWLAEFCAYDPKRLAGVAMIPSLTIEEMVKEIERSAKLGYKTGLLDASFEPEGGYGAAAYDRVWAAFQDAGMIAAYHTFNGKWWWPRVGAEEERSIHKIAMLMDYPVRRALIEMIFWGVFDRHPELKVVVAEFRIGWLPHFLWAADDRFETRPHWKPMPKRLPTDYWKEQMWAVTLHEPLVAMSLPHIGEDRLMWSSDYPHVESTWPKSQEGIDELLPGVSEETRQKVLHDNTVNLYQLEAA